MLTLYRRLWTLVTAVALLGALHKVFTNYTSQPPYEPQVLVQVQVYEPVKPSRISVPSPRPLALEEHIYHADGLLEPVAAGRHPVYDLIARAEKEWKAKQKRASRTLKEAVAEYTRRYARQPPKGFDKWCVQPFCSILRRISP